jgi:hypothetical protein
MFEFVTDDELAWVYNEVDIIERKLDDLFKHGDKEEIWVDWDPQQNLLRLVRNAASEADGLDPGEYNEASDYYKAVQKYDPSGFGEEQAKQDISSTRSLASKLAHLSNADGFESVDHNTYSGHRNSEYTIGHSSGNYKQLTVDSLEDIFELPCFHNMKEALKLENSGPVRKDLYNFVRMVYWLEGYHELPEERREDAVVSDIHDLFEKMWDWYDPDETEYQTRYEIRNGEINGDIPLPMHCHNDDMQRHCIGKRACPYSIYHSLPFPDEMYDRIDDDAADREGKYQQ